MEEIFDINKACKAQAELCKEKKYPNFAPKSGVCYSCGHNIYTQIDRGTYKTGISVERATKELITGCPHCHRSYCD